MSERHDVVIAGAGPVGLIAALKLARAGRTVLVADRLSSPSTAPRAVGYQWPSPRILEDIGLLDEAIAAGLRKTELEFRRPATGEVIHATLKCLQVADGDPEPFDIALGQDTLAEIALSHLEKLDNVELRWNSTVTGLIQDQDEVRVTLDGDAGTSEVRGSWLLGADGYNSQVRELLGLGFEGHSWPERFVATNVYYDFEKHGWEQATFVSDPADWAFVIKINADGLWRVTYGEDASLPKETVRDRVDEHYRQILPDPDQSYELAAVNAYVVHEKCATLFREGRVLLAGDAAHVCNPSGGQGLLGGIYDANAVAIALTAVLEGVRTDSVLDYYANERRSIFLNTTSPQATQFKAGMMNPAGIEGFYGFARSAVNSPTVMRALVSRGQNLVGTFPIGPGARLS